jgi:hypothetical protein
MVKRPSACREAAAELKSRHTPIRYPRLSPVATPLVLKIAFQKLPPFHGGGR